MSDYNKQFGRRISDARKNLDLTMKELGKLVDLHESTVQRYEMDIKELQILLGHSTMKLTADTYTHVLDKQKKKAINKTAHLFEGLK